MFTGIIESLGKIVKTERIGSNLELWVSCDFTNELKVDQTVRILKETTSLDLTSSMSYLSPLETLNFKRIIV